ncbi:MAG: zinc ribbon domain-containing protein [Phycisphaerae bacterium]|nr:zinc ribbon domain-containing protein [Phycisphaerae bacterium]
MSQREGRPLDDQPDEVISSLRRAPVSGEVVGRGGMTRREDPDDADEGPSREDLERFGGVTRACPACGKEIYDDAQVCWSCGHALMREPRRLPTWGVVVIVLIVLGMLAWVWR